jgi:hypothetical protein
MSCEVLVLTQRAENAQKMKIRCFDHRCQETVCGVSKVTTSRDKQRVTSRNPFHHDTIDKTSLSKQTNQNSCVKYVQYYI